jgi:Flp pilus assembly pilin Flp
MVRRRSRAGVSLVQWVLIAAVITLGVVAGVTLIGTNTTVKLNQTATDVATPSSLTTRFGS